MKNYPINYVSEISTKRTHGAAGSPSYQTENKGDKLTRMVGFGLRKRPFRGSI
jgi:hypothetical protein